MYTFALGLLFVPWHFYFLLLWSSLKAGIKFGLCVLQLFSGRMFSLHRQQFAVHVFASSRLTISGQAQILFSLSSIVKLQKSLKMLFSLMFARTLKLAGHIS